MTAIDKLKMFEADIQGRILACGSGGDWNEVYFIEERPDKVFADRCLVKEENVKPQAGDIVFAICCAKLWPLCLPSDLSVVKQLGGECRAFFILG